MKKRNEGYTLVLVLVVLVILCLMASYLLTFSLRNLHTQKAAALREQHRYAAVGEIEEAVGSLQAFAEKNVGAELIVAFTKPENSDERIFLLTTSEEFKKKEQDRVEENWILLSGVKDVKMTVVEKNIGGLSLELVSCPGSIQINCKLQLLAVIGLSEEKDIYTVTDFSGVEYVSYDISMVEGGTADE